MILPNQRGIIAVAINTMALKNQTSQVSIAKWTRKFIKYAFVGNESPSALIQLLGSRFSFSNGISI